MPLFMENMLGKQARKELFTLFREKSTCLQGKIRLFGFFR
ncbi:hypothetical protein BSG1_16150 [Bacillus sp. SG-1]|nr:hypothetical protein BSG1_16150 [Bacillus sp. SG-1]